MASRPQGLAELGVHRREVPRLDGPAGARTRTGSTSRSGPRRRAGRRRAPGRLDTDSRAAGDRPRSRPRTRRRPSRRPAAAVASQGMSGWSHSSQARRGPSGDGRGAGDEVEARTRGPARRRRSRRARGRRARSSTSSGSRSRRRVVRLADGVQPVARGVEPHVGVAATAPSGVIATGSAARGVEPVQPPVRRDGGDDRSAVPTSVRAAAVLVDAVPDVERRGRDLAGCTVRAVPEQRPPAALGGPALEPVDVVAVDRRLADADRRGPTRARRRSATPSCRMARRSPRGARSPAARRPRRRQRLKCRLPAGDVLQLLGGHRRRA